MSIVNKLKALKSNLFGGDGNTGETRPPASTVQSFDLQKSPTGLLDIDPLGFSTMSYPLDVQNNFQNGHYMLFYVNVQDKTKYRYGVGQSIDLREIDNKILKGMSEREKRYNKLQAIRTGRDLRTDGGGGTGNSTTYGAIGVDKFGNEIAFEGFRPAFSPIAAVSHASKRSLGQSEVELVDAYHTCLQTRSCFICTL